MSDVHEPESTSGSAWLELEDGITCSRRPVLTSTYAVLPASVPASAVARTETAEPTALAKSPDLPELLLETLRLFDAVGAHIPRRISDEELGDALEAIHKMVQEGQPRWRIQVRILSTLFWVSAHSVQDCVHELVGTETAATGSGRTKSRE
ncbi:hypothetical protein [Vitiosangium sp. GDMCC 1.1324]|uniref:hypothetical protein n=1 Tax=Vitiosangium sp. (strain GDMCC 1.1324) TaxID=2138576 RepID=UPI000D393EA9|nr:hypothetical protein [Vitiosangium sp. GDMCC 1.1324]PTL82157.1 hypothetical protein DAT35_20395 [Vitiosangium sp. GDMCC 1.1324]